MESLFEKSVYIASRSFMPYMIS